MLHIVIQALRSVILKKSRGIFIEKLCNISVCIAVVPLEVLGA